LKKIFHGSPSGIDNTVSTFGGSIIYSKGNFNKYKNIPNQMEILVIDTKVERSTKEIISKVKKIEKITKKK